MKLNEITLANLTGTIGVGSGDLLGIVVASLTIALGIFIVFCIVVMVIKSYMEYRKIANARDQLLTLLQMAQAQQYAAYKRKYLDKPNNGKCYCQDNEPKRISL